MHCRKYSTASCGRDEARAPYRAANVLEELEVSEVVHAVHDQLLPVHALQLQIRVVLLEAEVHRLAEVDVRPLDCVRRLLRKLELGEIEILWKHLHFNSFKNF